MLRRDRRREKTTGRRPVAILVLSLAVAFAWAVTACGTGRPDTAAAAAGGSGKPDRTAGTRPPGAAPAPPADATITNAPALGGSTVLHLPALPAGETRSIVGDDGSFVIAASGDLARGFAAIPTATTRQVTVRQTRAADGSVRDTTFSIAVTAADWSIDAFPEMIVQSLTQESVPTAGPLAKVDFGGIAQLAKSNESASAPAGSEPVKLDGGNGIAFAGGKHLSFKSTKDAILLYRWSLVIFRPEATGTGTTVLAVVNDGPRPGGRSGNWIPRIEYDATAHAVAVAYHGTQVHRLTSPAGSVAADGRWNVALTYRRHGRLFLRVNGQDCGQPSPTEGFSAERPEDMVESRIGDTSAGAPGWALDGLWLGQSELSEPVVAKMEAWALRRAGTLPGGAAGAPSIRPLVDGEDFPHRYVFDPARYAAWKRANPKEKRLAFQGQPAAKVQPDRSGWVRVFNDDFRKPAAVSARSINGSSVGDSTYDQDAGKQIWFAPGLNTAVGGKADCKDGNGWPWKDAYVHDPAGTTLTMRLFCTVPAKDGKPGRWRSSQFTSVNDTGVGYSWEGAKGFRIRARFNGDSPGIFPCPIWFYNLEHLFWRTGERVEFDVVELEHDWDAYGASHIHNGQLKGLFGHSAVDTMKRKTVPEEIQSLKLVSGKQVCGVNGLDGNFHTWEVWIERDLTYINVDGLEVARVATIPEYLQRLFLFIDTSLKDEKEMDAAKSYDLVLDQVEAFRPAADIDTTPGAPFTARPVLVGAGEVGSAVTCTANVAGCEDVWYFWYSDGYPRGFGRSPSHTVLAEDRGAHLRCMVKAVGAKDQPEAWTAPLTLH
jgi:hypothetical protein